MRILGLVFASFLLFSSPASSSDWAEYQADKKAYCDELKFSILKIFGISKEQKMEQYESAEMFRKMAADLSTIHIAICKD